MKGVCKNASPLEMVVWTLIVVGAINWGLVGIFDWNLVHWIFAFSDVVERIVYILVGIAGLYALLVGNQGKGKK